MTLLIFKCVLKSEHTETVAVFSKMIFLTSQNSQQVKTKHRKKEKG